VFLNPQEAEDLYQETFLLLHRARPPLVSGAVLLVSLEPANSVRLRVGFHGERRSVCALHTGFLRDPVDRAFRGGAPRRPARRPVTGAYAGAAAFLFAAAAVRIACSIDEHLHLLAWHMMPIAIGAALSAVAGARWLDR